LSENGFQSVNRQSSNRQSHHPVVRTLLFERLLITASATLALAAIAMGRVRPSEVPRLMDTRILTLFFVLTVAVELGKASGLFDRLAAAVFFFVPRRRLEPPVAASFDVDPLLAIGFFVLLAAEVASLFGLIPHLAPLAVALLTFVKN